MRPPRREGRRADLKKNLAVSVPASPLGQPIPGRITSLGGKKKGSSRGSRGGSNHSIRSDTTSDSSYATDGGISSIASAEQEAILAGANKRPTP